ncbi:hypothetical protein MEO43_08690, partial [Dolichospermum sp. ST_sed5]|nr:hypothetical protein [Dolichospermum sp. ST_sed5]
MYSLKWDVVLSPHNYIVTTPKAIALTLLSSSEYLLKQFYNLVYQDAASPIFLSKRSFLKYPLNFRIQVCSF